MASKRVLGRLVDQIDNPGSAQPRYDPDMPAAICATGDRSRCRRHLLEAGGRPQLGGTWIAGTAFGSRPRPFPFAEATCKPSIPVWVFN
jgi:hypothetical protein